MPRWLRYHALSALGSRARKKKPPMPVTLSICTSLARWRSSLAAELGPVELAHFALDVPILPVHLQEALGQLDRLRLRLRLEDRVAADHFLRLRERPIDRGQLAAAQAHAYPFLGRPEPRSTDQPAGARHLVYQLAHVSHELLAGNLAGVLLDTDHRQKSHGSGLLG